MTHKLNTTYRYRVRATDAAGNLSGYSSTASTLTHPATAPFNECANMQPGWVFCSGFEEGNKNIWDDYDGNPDSSNQLVSNPGPSNATGNTVMRFNVPNGSQGADLVKELPSTYDKLYARWYVRYPSNYNFSANNHGGGLHAGDRNYLGRSDYRPDGTDWFGAWVEVNTSNPHNPRVYTYYRGMYQDCADPNGSCWGDCPPVNSNPFPLSLHQPPAVAADVPACPKPTQSLGPAAGFALNLVE